MLEGCKYQLANTAAEQAKVDERRRQEAQTLAEIGKRRRVHCRADVSRLMRRPCCFGSNESLLDRLQDQLQFIKKSWPKVQRGVVSLFAGEQSEVFTKAKLHIDNNHMAPGTKAGALCSLLIDPACPPQRHPAIDYGHDAMADAPPVSDDSGGDTDDANMAAAAAAGQRKRSKRAAPRAQTAARITARGGRRARGRGRGRIGGGGRGRGARQAAFPGSATASDDKQEADTAAAQPAPLPVRQNKRTGVRRHDYSQLNAGSAAGDDEAVYAYPGEGSQAMAAESDKACRGSEEPLLLSQQAEQ